MSFVVPQGPGTLYQWHQVLPLWGDLRSLELFASKQPLLSVDLPGPTCSSICQALRLGHWRPPAECKHVTQRDSTSIYSVQCHLLSSYLGCLLNATLRKEGRRRKSGEVVLFWPKWRVHRGVCLLVASIGGGEGRTLRERRRRNQVGTTVTSQSRSEGAVSNLAEPLEIQNTFSGNLYKQSPVSHGFLQVRALLLL